MDIGLDVGSTTLKCVVVDDNGNIVFDSYQRHFSKVAQSAAALLETVRERFGGAAMTLCVSGSAGMGLAQGLGLPFIQEVYATRLALKRRNPQTDVAIELGGEDAKILFLTNGLDVRMNGSCAGGTGAFIDQMAALLDIGLERMNDLALEAKKSYTIASRCGVFAKSDIQPLLNQGAQKQDISAGIFAAVVNQTITGLAQGRPIAGNVVYLGGPLTFFSALRHAFDQALGVEGLCPERSLLYVAAGAAYSGLGERVALDELIQRVRGYASAGSYARATPLFADEAARRAFAARHSRERVATGCAKGYAGEAYLGIDAGSTTVKAAVIGRGGELLHSRYLPNSGNPVPIIRDFLTDFYTDYPHIRIAYSAVTGYGEDIIKNAFLVDLGVVETIAHYTAARRFCPEVDFIIDIGGQDIKCFKIRDGVIDDIFLNEACSSGCGSFLQTFAGALGYSIEDFAALGLASDNPVDLGTRCTVFMNSSVKQAQKEGASLANISAGLSISVMKNALYKVIRAASADGLGKNIVAQGGTFLNDAVLRAFENEIGRDVVRPDIAGLMGAYGAALYAMENARGESTLMPLLALSDFTHTAKAVDCGLCSNRCKLTLNTFSGGRTFIGGNRCSRPLARRQPAQVYNLFADKLTLLGECTPKPGPRGKIGLPMGLNMYELLPFWHAMFTSLRFEVVTSEISSRALYLRGQHTIPSDTVCYPAKLMHGHIQELIDRGVGAIFYPCMTYNLDEGKGDNHYNCPVVAYYPEVLSANVAALGGVRFIYDYLGIHRRPTFVKRMHACLKKHFQGISLAEVKAAADKAYAAHDAYLGAVRRIGRRYLDEAQAKGMRAVVLAGRPYHIDPEINHGIAQLLCEFGVVVLSEDAVSGADEPFSTDVLNQWTYHARLYDAARFCAQRPDVELVQLVSFGCGLDAITTDEVQRILHDAGKIYTQIKIDEITNLGAVKIRLRSLFAAIEQRERAGVV